MNKGILLGSFLMLILVTGLTGVVDAESLIYDIKIAAHDEDNQPDNQYGIRLSRITVEGELDDNTRAVLGTVNLGVDTNVNGVLDPGEFMVKIVQGDLMLGGHELAASSGTHIVSRSGVDDMVETDGNGDFLFTFVLPADMAGTADVTLLLWFGNEEGDLDVTIYRPELLDLGIPASWGSREFEFAVQVPILREGQVDDDVYRNGSWIEIQVGYETPDTGPPLSNKEEIELLTILPDFSNVDSEFALGNSRDSFGNPLNSLGPLPNNGAGRYDLTRWVESDYDPNNLDMYDLALDVDRAMRDGRLFMQANGGDYDVAYRISDGNRNGSGRKRLFIYALDYPFVMDIFDAPHIFNAFGLSLTQDINIATWATCATEACYDDDYGDILLDNMAPNFDFAVINPFVNTPLRRWSDSDMDQVMDPDEWSYVYRRGDIISVMIQIDPHDLTDQELNEVEQDEVSDTGNENGTVSNIVVIGDISALLDPARADLITDRNSNGIPDDAEVYTVEYAGGNGRDDDFDGGVEGNVDDDEDSTLNGFNERYIYILNIEVTDSFRGASGDRPYTTPPLPIRFMIEDDSYNRSYYSTWREEMFDYENWRWRDIPSNEIVQRWGREPGSIEGIRNPMYLDPEGEDEIFCPDGVYQYPPGNPNYPSFVYSSLSHDPTPENAKTPPWTPGYNILAKWDQPFRVIIDAAPPNVSIIRDIKQLVGTSDQGVIKGAAVVPPSGNNNVNHTPQTILTGGRGNFVSPGNFIYEISGNQSQLVTLEACFPSDNDVYFVKFQYSENDVDFVDMKGSFGDYEKSREFVNGRLPRESLLNYDIAGNITDVNVPGAGYGLWHDALNGDDDGDSDADLFDREVDRAHSSPLSDGRDNDADGLVDMDDRDDQNRGTEVYDRARDDDEDGIMDEDEFVIPAWFDVSSNSWIARWTFDPVRIARVLRLETDRAYAIRALAFDQAGNVIESAAAPIYLVFRVLGPGIQEPEGSASVQIYKDGYLITGQSIRENRVYDLIAVTTGNVRTVAFQYSIDKKTWVNIPTAYGEANPDSTPPFRISWRPMSDQLASDLWWDWDEDGFKDPGEPGYQFGDVLYIRAQVGGFGPLLGRYQVVDGLELFPYAFAPYAPDMPAPPLAIPPAPTVSTIMSEAPSLVLDLDEGWNLISVCLDTGDTDLLSVLSSIEGSWNSVWTFDSNPGWRWHVYGAGDSFNTLDTIASKKGYWIDMSEARTLVISGEELIDTAIPLSAGPNLVGYNSLEPRQPSDALSSIANDYNYILTYSGGVWQGYGPGVPDFLRNLDLVKPGGGYLIHAERDCNWTLPGNGN